MSAKESIRNFEYTDTKGKTSTRTALFRRLPQENLKAIDITEMSEAERAEFELAYDRYLKFLENVRAPSFEDWLDESDVSFTGDLKYRTFNIKRIKLLG